MISFKVRTSQTLARMNKEWRGFEKNFSTSRLGQQQWFNSVKWYRQKVKRNQKLITRYDRLSDVT